MWIDLGSERKTWDPSTSASACFRKSLIIWQHLMTNQQCLSNLDKRERLWQFSVFGMLSHSAGSHWFRQVTDLLFAWGIRGKLMACALCSLWGHFDGKEKKSQNYNAHKHVMLYNVSKLQAHPIDHERKVKETTLQGVPIKKIIVFWDLIKMLIEGCQWISSIIYVLPGLLGICSLAADLFASES